MPSSMTVTVRSSVPPSRFVDDMKLSGEFDAPKEWDIIQKDLETFKKWVFHEV